MTVEEQLQELRERWKKADPVGKRIIEIRARLLKGIGFKKEDKTEDLATEIFLDKSKSL